MTNGWHRLPSLINANGGDHFTEDISKVNVLKEIFIQTFHKQWQMGDTVCVFTLTHWGLDEMVDISKVIFLDENCFLFLFKQSLKVVPRVPINKKLALIEILAWYSAGNNSLSEPIVV